MVLNTIKYDEDGCVWNFAYGSNMNVNTLTKRRKIKPLESVGGSLKGWRLSFEFFGFPFVEPAFAVVHPTSDDNDCCHGVLHKMTKSDFIKLLRSEGGGGFEIEGYRPAEVIVDAYDGRKIRAYTLTSTTGVLRKGLYPSRRYLTILYEGAVHHKLNQEWLEFLAAHPHHVSSVAGKVVFMLLMVLLLPVFLLFFLSHLLYPVRYIHVMFYYLTHFLWYIHDLLPCWVQGSVKKLINKSA